MRAMSAHESSIFIDNARRRRILLGIVESYYQGEPADVVCFDMNRGWCGVLPAVVELLPTSRVVCCVRSPAWILDSIERLVQLNPLVLSKLFDYDSSTVYNRVEALATTTLLAPALNGLRQAWFSDYADRLVVVRYDSLVEQPRRVVEQLYALLDERPFEHDFEGVEYDEKDFDALLGLPGLHRASGAVRPRPRATVLPADLFRLYDREFWSEEGGNPRGVTIL